METVEKLTNFLTQHQFLSKFWKMVDIDTLTAQDCEDQSKSPLFGVLPAEIRNYIFLLSLLPYEDKNRPYKTDTYWYRPNHTCVRRSDTALLLTCRRIFLETRSIPLAEAVFTRWFESDRCPPSAKQTTDIFPRPKPRNRKHPNKTTFLLHQYENNLINHVQVFGQLYWIENFGLCRTFPGPKFGPRKLTITIRHTDWWWWEEDRDLRMNENWVRGFKVPDNVEVIEVEFETVYRKREQLDRLVSRYIAQWEFTRRDGSILSAKGTTPLLYRWTGSATFEGFNYEPEQPEKPEILDYYVLTGVWSLT